MVFNMKNFSYLKVTLTIVTLCSMATFYGVWQILASHTRSIRTGAKTDWNIIRIMQDLEREDQSCQDRLKIVEEQIDTLYEYNELYHGDDKQLVKTAVE